MQRAALALVLFSAIVGAGLFVNSIDSSDPVDSKNSVSTVTDRDVTTPEASRNEMMTLEQGGEQGEASASSTIASESVARWISEASSDNSTKRAVAIRALGAAPKSVAVPVLQKIFSAGAEGDRQLALNSLRTLALEQGDADGIIRDTIRLTVYDGDEYVVADAQAVLEEIEHNLDGAVNGWR